MPTPTLSKNNTLTPILSKKEDVYKVLGKWLYLKDSDYEVIDIFIASVLDRKILGDPIWLFIVAPSGGTKSELIRSVKNFPGTYSLSSLTSKTLISGKIFKSKEGDTEIKVFGLAQKLDCTVLLIKDFTIILDLPSAERSEIFAQFRDIYDGYIEKAFGNFPEPIRIKCKMGLIAGVTPAIDHYQKIQTTLGERFLKVRMHTIDKLGVLKASRNTGHEVEMRKEIGRAVKQFLMDLRPKKIELTEEQRKVIVDCATYISLMRTWVYVKYGYRGEIIEINPADPESPTRVVKQLTKLANLLAVVRGHDKIEDDDLETIKRVSRDTGIPKRQRVVEALIKHNCSAIISLLAGTSKLNFKTVKQEVEKMESLGMLVSHEDTEDTSCCFTDEFIKLSNVVNSKLTEENLR